ncbi:hypothetical protein EXM22_14045 [Oceanispirochaeta crateris]|uniref:Uncharacterized protein n=1 Tax=Oceanispirochaeta crateris TaxID=2518645 RepID=A0A5C1QLS0_9SPIO|nr:hypothetical protein [Oceanispirochaeta crateris]QEN09055.1 hypothetical protein EXM22_14045 [Oceanispirochaeta crateris]
MKQSLTIFLILLFSGTALFAETTKTIIIENNLENPVYYLYLSPDGEREWGEDRLGDDILDPESTIEIDVDFDEESPLFDLLAEDEIEQAYRIENINLSDTNFISIGAENLLPAGGFNPVNKDLTFINETGESIYYLYISSRDSMYWGEDLLGDEILYDGESLTLTVPIDGDYPNYDILAEGESSASYEMFDTHMLERDTFTFTEENMTSSGDEYDYDDYNDYDDYDDYGYDDLSSENDSYLEGYRDGYRDAWKDAYGQGFSDAIEN